MFRFVKVWTVFFIGFFLSATCWSSSYYEALKQGDTQKAQAGFNKDMERCADSMTSAGLCRDAAITDFLRYIKRLGRYDFGITICSECLDRKWDEQKEKGLIRLGPNAISAKCLRALSSFWLAKGKYKKAIENYEKALALQPEQAWNYHSFALLLATCPDDKYRNGKRAFDLSEKAIQLEKKHSHFALTAQAAAFAELGKFEEAVEKQKEAIEKLKTEKIPFSVFYPEHFAEDIKNIKPLMEVYNKRLSSFQAKKSWRLKLTQR